MSQISMFAESDLEESNSAIGPALDRASKRMAEQKKSGAARRDKGIALADSKTTKTDPQWKERAADKLAAFLKQWELSDFTAEEAQLWMLQNGLDRPASTNSWGGVFMASCKRAEIEKTGEYRTSAKPSANARAICVWRKKNG